MLFLAADDHPLFIRIVSQPYMSDGFAYRSAYTLAPGQPSPGLGYVPASHLLIR